MRWWYAPAPVDPPDGQIDRPTNKTPTHLTTKTTTQAKDLRIADLRSSDPYVKIRYGVNQKYDTKVRAVPRLGFAYVCLGREGDGKKPFEYELNARGPPVCVCV